MGRFEVVSKAGTKTNNNNNQRFTIVSQANQKSVSSGKLPTKTKDKKKAGILETAGKTALTGVNYLGQGTLKAFEEGLDTLGQVATSNLNPYYWFNQDKLKSHQNIANEIAARDMVNEYVNRASGRENFNQEVLDENSLIKENNLGGQVVKGIGGMLPSIAVASPTKAGKIASTAALATNAYGGGVEEAYQSGATRGQATAYGLLDTATELGTEWMTGGIPGTKSVGYLDNIVARKLGEESLDQVSKSAGKQAIKYGYKILGEAFEEGLSEVINPLIKDLTYTSGETVNPEDVLNAMLVGGITGGILEAPSNISDINTARKLAKETKVSKTTKPSLPKKTNVARNEEIAKNINKQASDVDSDFAKFEQEQAAKNEQRTKQKEVSKQETVQEVEEVKEQPKEIERKPIKENKELYNKINNEKQIIHTTNDLNGLLNSEKIDSKIFAAQYQNKGLSPSKYGEQGVKFKPEILDYINEEKLFKGDGATNREGIIKENPNKFKTLEEYIDDDTSTSGSGKYNELTLKRDLTNDEFLDLIESVSIPKNSSKELINNLESHGIDISYYEPKPSYNKTKQVETTEETTQQEDGMTQIEKIKAKMQQGTETKQEVKDEVKPEVKQEVKAEVKQVEETIPVTPQEETKKDTKIVTNPLEYLLKKQQDANIKAINDELGVDNVASSIINNNIISENDIKQYEKKVSQKGVTSTKVDSNVMALSYKTSLSKEAKTISSQMRTSTYWETTKEGVSKADVLYNKYDKYLAAGGEAIEGLGEFKHEYEKRNASKIVSNLVEETKKAQEKLNVGDNIQLFAEKTSDKLQNLQVISDITETTTMEELSNVLDELDKNRKESIKAEKSALNKNADGKEIKATLGAQLLDQASPIMKMDKINKNFEGEKAWTNNQKATGEGIAQITEAQTDLQGNVVGLSLSDIQSKYYDLLDDNTRPIWEERAKMKMDLAYKERNAQYGSEILDTIYPGKDTEYLKTMLDYIDTKYPTLAKAQEETFKDIRKYYDNMNQARVDAGLMSKTIPVDRHYAKDVMGLSDEYIKENTAKDGSVIVNTVDNYHYFNPYYFKIERDVPSAGNRLTIKTNMGKSVYDPSHMKGGNQVILPMFDGMTLEAVDNRKLLRQNQLYATVAHNDTTYENNSVSPQERGKVNTITYYENGKPKTVRVSADMFTALDNSGYLIDNAFENIKTLKAVKKLNAVEKDILTSMSPGFVLRNAFRDLGEANLNSNYNNISYNKEWLKSFKDMSTNSDMWQEYKRTGLFNAGIFDFNKDKGLVKKSEMNVAQKGLDKLEKLSQYSEALARFTEYKLARNAGHSIEEASRQAKNITVDFSRAGKAVKALDRNFTKFLGAGEAGAIKFYDTTIGNTKEAFGATIDKLKGNQITERQKMAIKKAEHVVARLAAIGITAGIANGIMHDDEDKEFYDSIPEYTKDKNYIIRTGENSYVTIPMARTVGLINKLFTNANVPQEDRVPFMTVLSSTIDYAKENVLPNNPQDSNVITDISQLIKNEDHYGNKIYDTEKDGAIKISTKVGDHILSSYGTDIYKIAKYVAGPNKHQKSKTPIIGDYIKYTDDTNALSSKLYSMTEKSKQDTSLEGKAKTRILQEQYTKYIKPIKDKIALKEESLSAYVPNSKEQKEIKKLYDKLNQTYVDILNENYDDMMIYDDGIYYMGQWWDKTERKDKQTGKVTKYYRRAKNNG